MLGNKLSLDSKSHLVQHRIDIDHKDDSGWKETSYSAIRLNEGLKCMDLPRRQAMLERGVHLMSIGKLQMGHHEAVAVRASWKKRE